MFEKKELEESYEVYDDDKILTMESATALLKIWSGRLKLKEKVVIWAPFSCQMRSAIFL
ncbi:hypothetical protein [Bartonella sp. DB5-6]|uniref:hypothetical protein n=1 Tax=Bartonella sp. DB5-6 TaxID=1094755 RepID=UPI0002DB4EC3|nr:hypothetical protein [Bartonella sp. DB5-6]